MDGIPSQLTKQAPPINGESASPKPGLLVEQPTLPASAPGKQVVHAFASAPVYSRGGASRTPQSPAYPSRAITSASSTLRSYNSSSGDSLYLKLPIVEGDELPPFRPEKGDRVSLSMYGGPQNFEVNERHSRNRIGDSPSSQLPRIYLPQRRRRVEKHRIAGLTDLEQHDERTKAAGLKSSVEGLENGRNSTTSSFISPSFSTLLEGCYVSQRPGARWTAGPSSLRPIQEAQLSGQRGLGSGLSHQAILNRKWSVGVGTLPFPSFLKALAGLYTGGGPRLQESPRETSEIQEEERTIRNKKAHKTGSEQQMYYKRRKSRANKSGKILDTPAIIVLRRATGSGYQMENGKIAAEHLHRMSRQREDDLRDSIIDSFLEGKHRTRSCGHYGGRIATEMVVDIESEGSPFPNLIPAKNNNATGFDEERPRYSLFGKFGLPETKDREKWSISSPSSVKVPGRSRVAEPVITYIASIASCNQSILDQSGNPAIKAARRTSTVQSIHCNSSVYEVIWQDDYTPSDFVTKEPVVQQLESPNSSDAYYSGNSSSSSDSDKRPHRQGKERRLRRQPSIERALAKSPGWSWSGSSRRESHSTRVQFGFQLRSDSAPIRRNSSTTDQAADATTPDLFIDSFPPLPERKSTLDWKKPPPSIEVSGSEAEADSLRHAETLSVDPASGKRLGSGAGTETPSPVESGSQHLGNVSPRGREPKRRSVVLSHPAAHPRTAEETKVGFALGISGGHRRRRSSNPARKLKLPSPKRLSTQRGHSESRVTDLKGEINEITATRLPKSSPDNIIDDFMRHEKRSTPSRLSGSSTPQSGSKVKSGIKSGLDQVQVRLPLITVGTTYLSDTCSHCVDTNEAWHAGGKLGSRMSVDWIG